MAAKSERFEMRLDQATLKNIDNWRSMQNDLPPRSEAVRRLIEVGLNSGDSQSEVRLTDGEKLILCMLCDFQKALKINGETNPDFIKEVIFGGHYWGLNWELSEIFHGDKDSKEIVNEVVEVLGMWDFLEGGYERMSVQKKKTIQKEAGVHKNGKWFSGFDGNGESKYLGVASFLIETIGRFQRFKGRDLNSHIPYSVEKYKRMLSIFRPELKNNYGKDLSMEKIIQILNA